MASRGGKQMQHSGILPTINKDKCVACRECAQWCPVDAITVEEHAHIDQELCIGCGECTVTCQYKAIAVRWDESSVNLQKKIAEHAYTVLNNIKGKSCFFNFLINVTKNCDCIRRKEDSYFPAIGIVASTDIVAADQATFDLLKEAERGDVIDKWFGKDGQIQLRHAEEIGLGSRKYKIEEV